MENTQPARVAVIGAGYVGVVTAVGLASLGHRVTLTERDENRLAGLAEGRVPFYEPGLQELFEEKLDDGLLTVSGSNADAAASADVVMLTLPTPPGVKGRADLSIIEGVLVELSSELGPDTVVAVKSTTPAGSTRRFQARLHELGSPAKVVSNPEFLAEGRAIRDFFEPDRVVVGGDDDAAVARVAALYADLDAPTLLTDPQSSEMIKYASNAYLASRITLVNGLANVCDVLGADIEVVTKGIGLDTRIGPHFLRPGPGFGGSCFPKDITALIQASEDAGYDFRLLKAVVDADKAQRDLIVTKLDAELGSIAGRHIGLWGLTYKAGTSDTRVSPAVKLANRFVRLGATVTAHDPEADVPSDVKVDRVDTPIAAAVGADALVVATEWPVYADVDLGAVAEAMAGNLIYDARNVVDPDQARAAGLTYIGVGRR